VEEADKAKAKFLAMMSYELRTPLTGAPFHKPVRGLRSGPCQASPRWWGGCDGQAGLAIAPRLRVTGLRPSRHTLHRNVEVRAPHAPYRCAHAQA